MVIDDRLRALLNEIGTVGVCEQMVAWIIECKGMTDNEARQLIRGSASSASEMYEGRIESLVAELRRLQAVVCEQDSDSIDAVIGEDESGTD